MTETMQTRAGVLFKATLTLLIAALPALLPLEAAAQPVLPASSRSYTIIDNGDRRNAGLVDDVPLDTYVYHPAPSKMVTIETDQARQVFRFAPGETADFAIRYKGRLYPHRLAPVEPHRWLGPAELVLPFTIGRDHAVVVTASINGSEPLRLLFDTGASVSVLTEEGRKKGAKLSGQVGSIRFGPVEVEDTPIIFVDYGGRLQVDGVLGYNVFLGRQVSLDYGRRELWIGKPGTVPAGFRSTALRWWETRTLVDIVIDDGRGKRTLPVLLDTGSKFSLSINNTDRLAQGLAGLERLGWRYARRADGSGVESRVFAMPAVSLAGFSLRHVQADVEQPGGETLLPAHILGNDFLRRFDLIIDYRNGLLHIRPNQFRGEEYNAVNPLRRSSLFALAGITAAAIIVALLVWLRRLRRRRAMTSAPGSQKL